MRNFAKLLAASAMITVIACPVMAQERTMSAPMALEDLVKKAPARPVKKQAPATIDTAIDALVKGEFEKARAIAEPLAAKGDASANYLLGYIHQNGLGVRPNIGVALSHYGDAAIKGNADAQLALGELAFKGDGVWPDYERAAGWFRLAVAQDDPRARVRLGLMLAEGIGLAPDRVAAADQFAKAAAKGDVDGHFYLGVALMNGDGVQQNYREAERQFEAAAKRGYGEAAYHLALLYDSQVLGPSDPQKAASHMAAAANAGFKPAYAAMGLMVHRGDADGLAADWFERGARAGDPRAALLYAVALHEGDGRQKDPATAIALTDEIIASPRADAPIKAEARRLRKTILATTAGPLTLRN